MENRYWEKWSVTNMNIAFILLGTEIITSKAEDWWVTTDRDPEKRHFIWGNMQGKTTKYEIVYNSVVDIIDIPSSHGSPSIYSENVQKNSIFKLWKVYQILINSLLFPFALSLCFAPWSRSQKAREARVGHTNSYSLPRHYAPKMKNMEIIIINENKNNNNKNDDEIPSISSHFT